MMIGEETTTVPDAPTMGHARQAPVTMEQAVPTTNQPAPTLPGAITSQDLSDVCRKGPADQARGTAVRVPDPEVADLANNHSSN